MIGSCLSAVIGEVVGGAVRSRVLDSVGPESFLPPPLGQSEDVSMLSRKVVYVAGWEFPRSAPPGYQKFMKDTVTLKFTDLSFNHWGNQVPHF